MSESKTIPAVHKAVSVVQYLADREHPVSVKELALDLRIPPASCYRLVRTLLEHNWVREDPAGGLRIGFGLAHVARSYSELETRLRDLNAPLRALANELEMSVKVTLREGDFAVTALRAEPIRPNAITSPIGYRFHLAIGSAAAVLLAPLEDREVERILRTAPGEVWRCQSPEDVWTRIQDSRSRGFCFDLGMQHASIYAASAPLVLSDSLYLSLTAVGWPEDFEGEKAEAIAQRVRRAAEELR
ncbi:MAG: IclR family transcriptional regulator [Puniceicoccales bacterium]